MAVCADCGTTYRRTKEAPACPSCGATRVRASAAAGAPSAAAASATAAGAPEGKPRKLVRQAASEKPAHAAPAAARHAPAAAEAGEKHARPVRHKPAGEAPVLDDASKYGLYGALGFGLIVGLICLFVFRAKAARQRELDEYEAAVKGVYAELTALDVNDSSKAEQIIKLAGAKEATWRGHDLEADIESLLVRARNTVTNSKEKSVALEGFNALEAEMQKGGLNAERLKELRRLLDESEVRLADGGADLVARIAVARAQAERLYAQQLLDDAAKASAAGTPRSGLVAYQTAEDELKTQLDRAFTAKNTELQSFYTGLYQQAIAKSDELASELFKSEGESLAWVDCLAPPQAPTNWNASSARGFSHRASGDGVLQLIGPDPEAGKMAVISIGDREQWRHYQVDIEFTIEKGDLDLFFRLGRGPNQNTLSYPLRTTGSGTTLRAEKKFAARVSVIGSKFSVRFAGEDIDTPAPFDEDVRWTMNRKGAIGFVVQPGARATFTKFKVRELR